MQGFQRIAGVDEVGRGALCGPVVAAAVMFSQRPAVHGIKDSKKLTPRQREKLLPRILRAADGYGIGIVSAEEIDRINIYQATLKAMRIALEQISPAPDFILFDGTRVNGILTANLNVIKGDARCITIAAASIVAKVTRDHLMQSYASMYPMYDWVHNKGYSCRNHFQALKDFGPASFHRRSFRPIQQDGQLILFEGKEKRNFG
jgi:ribonuclease HII